MARGDRVCLGPRTNSLGCAAGIVFSGFGAMHASSVQGDLRSVRVGEVVAAIVPEGRRADGPVVVLAPAFRERDPSAKKPGPEDVCDLEWSVEQLLEHGRCSSAPFLPPKLDVVPPHQEYRESKRRALPALRPGDRLSPVVRLRVANEKVDQIDLEERIVGVATLLGRSDLVCEPTPQKCHGPGIGWMVVASKRRRAEGLKGRLQEMPDVLLDRLRIRPAELPFERFATPLLSLGHAALAAQWAIGEGPKEAGLSLDEHVVVEGEELAVFEALEAVQDDRPLGV